MRISLKAIITVALIAFCSGSSGAMPVKPTIDFQVVFDRIAGLQLRVFNDSDARLCFPTRFLNTASPSIELKVNGTRPEKKVLSEYGERSPGEGPFYIAAPHRSSSFPIDTNALLMPTGSYTYRIYLSWFRCDDIDTSRDLHLSKARSRVIDGKVSYTAS